MQFAAALAPVSLRAAGVAVRPVPAITTETQRVSNWCWIASSVSIDKFYGGASSQCTVADQLLGRTTCCASPSSSHCNRTGVMEKALQHLRRHHGTIPLGGAAPTFATVATALALRRPPAAQFAFKGGNSHVVVLAGYGRNAAGEDFVRVGDPAFGRSPTDVVWSQAHQYRGGVSWTHVCWTKP